MVTSEGDAKFLARVCLLHLLGTLIVGQFETPKSLSCGLALESSILGTSIDQKIGRINDIGDVLSEGQPPACQ